MTDEEAKKQRKQEYDVVSCPKELDMKGLLDQCEALTPRDEHSRRVPRYVIVHEAIKAYLAYLTKLQKEQT